ncbi:putative FAD(NAD)-dependent oxidoreductase [Oenococcus oeni]|uniref:FAD/NAD(P)-binding protein n=1 Tax=Oenococcus oeni TaxID=1247 RepID=UPI0010B7FBA0|nr:FAD/NAD(P)-binding protein [Oenococcus oeni]SYV99899.1 putative FAD(NAD)-dependent oxidoreductase [Oenococcus oeni]
MKIAIIGAGPRGIAVADRLVARSEKEKVNVEIKMYDPYPIGGKVWNPMNKLNHSLITNTVVSQVSFFIDDSIENPGPIRQGPSFYEWIQQIAPEYLKGSSVGKTYLDKLDLKENDFAPRGLLGLYQQWFFENIRKQTGKNSSLAYEQTEIKAITPVNQQYKIDFSGTSEKFDFVFMALGYGENKYNDEERTFAEFAKRNKLSYFGPANPSETNLDDIPATQAVIIRGLGLTFFDYMIMLTENRGGKFVQDGEQLKYIASGREPIIFAGSRSGLPLHARGRNQKGPSEEYKPRFFTKNNLKNLKNHTGNLDYNSFFKLFDKEIQYKHYENLIKDPDYSNIIHKRTNRFLRELRRNPASNYEKIAEEYHMPKNQIWNWDRILNSAYKADLHQSFKNWYIKYLDFDIEDASKGNKDAPYAGAYDILRDIRNLIRDIFENQFFLPDDSEKFLTKFNAVNNFLSVGPPLIRIKQLRALVDCHIVNILGPEMKVENDPRNKSFFAKSQRLETINAKSLIEARLPSVDNDLATQPLRLILNKYGWYHKTRYQKNQQQIILNAAQINPKTYQLTDRMGQVVPGIYSAGIPHEGVSWFTTIIPRPGVRTIIYKEAAIISKEIIDEIKKITET